MKKNNIFIVFLFMLVALFTLAACKQGEAGAKGETGDKGPTGEQGKPGNPGAQGDTGDTGDKGEDGADAKAPEFQVTEAGVQWRYTGDEEWKTLITIEDFIGYSKKYTISFDANGGADVAELINQVYKTDVELPTPKLAGYTFAYWQDPAGNEVENNVLKVTENIKLKAVWASSVELSKTALGEAFDFTGLTEGDSFKITKFNSGSNDGYTIDLGTKAQASSTAGTYWYRIFLKAVDADNGVYEIVGRLTSGESNSLADYDYDLLIGTHSACTDTEGYGKLRAIVEAEESPVGNIVKVEGLDLSAAAGELATAWTAKIYSGYQKDIKLVLKGEKLTLEAATATGKTFVGWSADGATLVNGEITPAGDIAYRPVFNYTVSFNANGGSAVADKVVAAAADYAAALPETTNAPKVFAGWFADEALTKEVKTLPLVSCTLYAKWEIPTTVTYNLDGGMLLNAEDSFNCSTDTSYLNNGFSILAIAPATTNQVGRWWNIIFLKSTETPNVYSVVEVSTGGSAIVSELGTSYDFIIERHGDNKDKEADAAFNRLSGLAKAGDLFYVTTDSEAKTASVYFKPVLGSVQKVYLDATDALPIPEKADCTFEGWYDGDTKVTSIAKAEAPTELTLTAHWKSGALTKEAIIAEFLKDVNASAIAKGYITEAITADAFYTTFNKKFMNVTAVTDGVYTTDGLMKDDEALLAKYSWLIEYVGAKMGDKKYGNTALVAFGLKSANDSNLVTSSLDYADKTITNSVLNFLTGTGENVHGGSSSGAVPADFSAANAYDGLIAAASAAGFTIAE